jgi:predicted DNA-binding ribbon-helix-helix protein
MQFICSKADKTTLEQIAKKEGVSLSMLVNKIVIEYIKTKEKK